jgi:hypothetical protein
MRASEMIFFIAFILVYTGLAFLVNSRWGHYKITWTRITLQNLALSLGFARLLPKKTQTRIQNFFTDEERAEVMLKSNGGLLWLYIESVQDAKTVKELRALPESIVLPMYSDHEGFATWWASEIVKGKADKHYRTLKKRHRRLKQASLQV